MKRKPCKLTKRQTEVLMFIQAYVNENCVFPSFGDIADHFRICRTTAYEHVNKMIDKWYLTSSGLARGIEYTDDAHKFIKENGLEYLTLENLRLKR